MRYRAAMKIERAALASALVTALALSAAAQDPSEATHTAPATFRAKLETTKGDVVFECTRDWAPHGVDRFYNLVKLGFFQDMAIFRVKHDFVAQWGIHGDPAISGKWRDANLPPDPAGKQSNTRGMLTYAMAGRPDTRSTQFFVNYRDNSNLDAMGFAPICEVVEGMEVADQFYEGYGERLTDKQGLIHAKGNAYLRENWPELDYIKAASIVGEPPPAPRAVSDGSASGSGSLMWWVAGLGAAAVAAYLVLRGRNEGAPPAPARPAAKAPAKETPSPTAPKRKKKKRKAR
jgi:peptidyl-prolyl cis-trans isomerase A (cyclophilin A)